MSNGKLSFLKTVLKPLGLSDDAINKTIDFISDLLFEKDESISSTVEYPYHLSEELITAAEHNFFLVLKSAVSGNAQIFSKINLADLFYAKTGDFGKNRSYMNRIDRKHADFLICDPKSLKPILAIELDDKSHQRADRQERDNFVNHVFEAAKLPLIHISVQKSYSVKDLQSKLLPYLSISQGLSEQPSQTLSSTPECPKCGNEMVMRTAKKGNNQGEQFWGCSRYPKCNGIIKIER